MEDEAGKRGRRPAVISPEKLREAAVNTKSFITIASSLDVSYRTLRRHMDADPTLELAYAQGRAERAGWVQQKIDAAIEKDPLRAQLLLMGMANQNPEQGGLGWSAPWQQIRLEGTIEIKTSPAQLAWNEIKQLDQTENKTITIDKDQVQDVEVTEVKAE